jgi:hypothetical protein
MLSAGGSETVCGEPIVVDPLGGPARRNRKRQAASALQ